MPHPALRLAVLAACLGAVSPAAADPFVFQLEGGILDKKDTYNVPTWDTVTFKYAYEQPVVLAIPNTNGDNPADFRLRNVGKTSFEVTLVEPPSEDGPHVAMSVAYVAVEAGKWSLPDGRKLAAGFVDTSQLVHSGGGGFQLVNLPIGFFAKTPVVFAQIQGQANETGNVPSKPSSPWLTTSVRNVTAAGFELALDGCECTSQPLAKPEHVGWVAIEAAGPGNFVDSDAKPVAYETLLTGPIVDGWDDKGAVVAFKQSYAKSPLFVARTQARSDADGGWLRYFGLGTKSVGLAVDEDRCVDGERTHTPEPAALFVFSQSFRVQDADPDKDGFASSVDVCPLDFDPAQQDADKDGRGDACDCGDGIVAAIEFCDDGGTAAGDGCSATCEVEAGFVCKGAPSACKPVCGDGLVRGAEACDDGDGDAGDGCFGCQLEPGWACAGEPSACTTTCGDGFVAGLEACDDGNLVGGDGCAPDCTVEPTTGGAGGAGATGSSGPGGGVGGSSASGGGAGVSGTSAGMGAGGDAGGAPGSCPYGPCTPDTLVNGRACTCAAPGAAEGASSNTGIVGLGGVLALGLRRRARRVARHGVRHRWLW